MVKLKKITVSNAEDVLSGEEMRNLLGGDDVAKSCSDHSDTTSCFGTCTEIVGGSLKEGKCNWLILDDLSYAGCACFI